MGVGVGVGVGVGFTLFQPSSLRSVCSLDPAPSPFSTHASPLSHPQLHLLLAQSYLEQLSLRLRPMRTTSEREAPDKLHSFPVSLLLLDNAGVLMEGVLGMGAAVATEKGDMSTTGVWCVCVCVCVRAYVRVCLYMYT